MISCRGRHNLVPLSLANYCSHIPSQRISLGRDWRKRPPTHPPRRRSGVPHLRQQTSLHHLTSAFPTLLYQPILAALPYRRPHSRFWHHPRCLPLDLDLIRTLRSQDRSPYPSTSASRTVPGIRRFHPTLLSLSLGSKCLPDLRLNCVDSHPRTFQFFPTALVFAPAVQDASSGSRAPVVHFGTGHRPTCDIHGHSTLFRK